MRVHPRLIPLLLPLLVLLAVSFVGCSGPPDLPVPPRSDLIIAGVTVINPESDRFVDHSIVVREGVIREVRPRLGSDPDPICVDCYALPGLIDAHVHTPPRVALGNQRLFALLYLAHGITTVRDVGESEQSVADLAARLNEGRPGDTTCRSLVTYRTRSGSRGSSILRRST